MRNPSIYRTLRKNEQNLCNEVYNGSLPPWDMIGIGDGLGLGDRPWTDWGHDFNWPLLPNMRYVMNIGDYATNDLTLKTWTPYDGNTSDLLIHEIAHVWQYYYGYTVKASSVWASTLGSYEYEPGEAWDDYNAEQQASIVEDWHKRGRKPTDLLYPYIVKIIWSGAKPELTKLTLDELKADVYIPPPPPPPTPNPTTITVGNIDSVLVPLLKKRYAANDVAGYGGRARQLEAMFARLDELEADAYLRRLSVRKAGDAASMYFYDHLSRHERAKLLNILREASRPTTV